MFHLYIFILIERRCFSVDKMELKKLIKTRQFLDEMSKSIEHIIWKSFPQLSREEREDISQEVKLKIWRKVSRGRKIDNLKSYLWRLVYTTCLDIINGRMNTLPTSVQMKVDDPKIVPQVNMDPVELLIEKKELTSIIENALGPLSQNRRMVIKLYLAGMKIDEIADFLGWTRSKVNHLYYRGLSELKKRLKKLKK